MKNKRKMLFAIVAASVLVCLLVVGAVFAFGTESGENKINLIVSTKAKAVSEGETFDVEVKISNEDITSFMVAGIQVELAYDIDKLAYTAITHTLDEEESTALSSETNGTLTFVAVKNEFEHDQGYTTLTDLFKATFTAKTDIKDASMIFTTENIDFLIGDTTATEVLLSNAVYAGSIPNIAKAILDKGFDVVTNAKSGTVVVAPTPVGTTALTKTELENSLANNDITVNDNYGVIGTGSEIAFGEEEVATIVVKGDVDGDGIVTVFDAMLIKEAQDNSNVEENFTDKVVQEFAGDVNNDNSTNVGDASNILDHVVGNDTIG